MEPLEKYFAMKVLASKEFWLWLVPQYCFASIAWFIRLNFLSPNPPQDLGYVWLNVNCFPSVKYFQVKIFFRKENIFRCLVAFQKFLWKIFFGVWLYSWKCFRKHIFIRFLTFSQDPNKYYSRKSQYINTKRNKKIRTKKKIWPLLRHNTDRERGGERWLERERWVTVMARSWETVSSSGLGATRSVVRYRGDSDGKGGWWVVDRWHAVKDSALVGQRERERMGEEEKRDGGCNLHSRWWTGLAQWPKLARRSNSFGALSLSLSLFKLLSS